MQMVISTLTPVPSPTQASDTEPLRSWNSNWDKQPKHVHKYIKHRKGNNSSVNCVKQHNYFSWAHKKGQTDIAIINCSHSLFEFLLQMYFWLTGSMFHLTMCSGIDRLVYKVSVLLAEQASRPKASSSYLKDFRTQLQNTTRQVI